MRLSAYVVLQGHSLDAVVREHRHILRRGGEEELVLLLGGGDVGAVGPGVAGRGTPARARKVALV